jgi:hypothetical protein
LKTKGKKTPQKKEKDPQTQKKINKLTLLFFVLYPRSAIKLLLIAAAFDSSSWRTEKVQEFKHKVTCSTSSFEVTTGFFAHIQHSGQETEKRALSCSCGLYAACLFVCLLVCLFLFFVCLFFSFFSPSVSNHSALPLYRPLYMRLPCRHMMAVTRDLGVLHHADTIEKLFRVDDRWHVMSEEDARRRYMQYQQAHVAVRLVAANHDNNNSNNNGSSSDKFAVLGGCVFFVFAVILVCCSSLSSSPQ